MNVLREHGDRPMFMSLFEVTARWVLSHRQEAYFD